MQTGQFRPRRPLPSEIHLQQRFGVARDTARKAISHLTSLGLVRTVPGRGTYVRAPEVTVIAPDPDMRIITRLPTDAERAELGLGAGVWVLVAERVDGGVEVLPGDAAEIRLE
ncbi:GntR family transcriptional regulator [Streptosporangium amethystogenes]|uniref:GntR family transcriptional regulator n=1 Tax=Streptosporangium amethystogenes TaxID=2002 RepID=UPI001FE137A2|nr:GntR family transcriptional regulator [Streptosporangium amethystogenes]